MTRQRPHRWCWILAGAVVALLPAACEHRTACLVAPRDQAEAETRSAAPLPESEGEVAAAPSVAPEPPRPNRIPEGCEWNLSGRYRLARGGRTPYLYQIDDDGQRAIISPASDAAITATGDEGMHIEVKRTPDGFVGRLLKTVAFDGGPSCQVAFEAQILACERTKGLRLSLVDDVEIDERCQVIQRRAAQKVELIRELE